MRIRASRLTGVLAALLLATAACGGQNAFTEPGQGGGGEGRTGSIVGQVTAAGVGVGNVQIILVGRDSVRTGSQGQYEFTNLPAATYTLQLRLPPNYTLAAGQQASQQATVAAGGSQPVNWLLRRDDTVQGARTGALPIPGS